ncbi:MAG TPA: twin-arginine translocase TatA/TatE family subunit [Nitrolancea sp.]|nr:twin-arginine translocase TatA/TatE family subunit [Nitrolancea sp.]
MFEGLFQPIHLILILAIIMIVFGAGKLPEMGGALGRGIKEFRTEVHDASDTSPTPPISARPVAGGVSTANAATTGAKFCTGCGDRLPVSAKFCPNCGTTVTAAEFPAVQSMTTEVEQPAAAPQENQIV